MLPVVVYLAKISYQSLPTIFVDHPVNPVVDVRLAQRKMVSFTPPPLSPMTLYPLMLRVFMKDLVSDVIEPSQLFHTHTNTHTHNFYARIQAKQELMDSFMLHVTRPTGSSVLLRGVAQTGS